MIEFNSENRLIIQNNVNLTNGVNTPANNSNAQNNPNSILVNNQTTVTPQNLNSIHTINPQTTNAQPQQPQTQPPNEAPFVKTGESISELMDRYYTTTKTVNGRRVTVGRYSISTPEEKRELIKRYITQHFTNLRGRSRSEQIRLQLSDFRKKLHNTRDPQDYEALSGAISSLMEENQMRGAESAMFEAFNEELKRSATRGVARAISECASTNQRPLTDMVIKTGYTDAIKIGAQHYSECATENIDYIHGAYFNLNNEEVQLTLGGTQISNIQDEAVQRLVFERQMTSEYQSVVCDGASHIYMLNPNNQTYATQITINTGNEEAINCAAQYAHLCDEDVRDEIKYLLYNSGYDSVRYTLYCSEEQTTTTSCNTSSSNSSVQDFKKAKINEKVKIINALTKSNKDSDIRELLRNATNAEKIAIISQLPVSSLPAILGIILDSNPSAEILSKVATIIGNMSSKDQNNIIQNLFTKNSSNMIANNSYLLDASSQRIFLSEMADRGQIKDVKRERLSCTLKDYYTELMGKTYE